jgi:outer membrane protein assembly factor BamA
LSDETILNAVTLSPGDTATVDVLERARLQLLNDLPILSDATFFTRPGSTRGTVVLEISLSEKETFGVETGYGYHDVNG